MPSPPSRTGDSERPDTHFASPERADPGQVSEVSLTVAESPLIQAIQESIDGYLMILNEHRQVLAVNRQLLADLGLQKPDCLVGDRPGEVLHCIHVPEGPGGCGTSKACASCGAVLSILSSQREGHSFSGECLATIRRNHHSEALEFRVRATPVQIGEHKLTVLVFQDISGDKRRQALERVFFHDLMNTIGGLQGWSMILSREEEINSREVAARIVALSQRLTQEVRDQRRLVEAESGTLNVEFDRHRPADLLKALIPTFEAHESSQGKTLTIEPANPEEWVTTDASLLQRVLTNMVKNAFEASLPGETVRAGFERREGRPCFYVHNNAVIPEDVALRIFQRSFSTKGGHGRGIGTYSMKLFGERYLGGIVDFESTERDGTVFRILLPEDPPR
jgi:signal transduction histidine kinase